MNHPNVIAPNFNRNGLRFRAPDSFIYTDNRQRHFEIKPLVGIEITDKIKELVTLHGDKVNYAFRLNSSPDQFWVGLFHHISNVTPSGFNRDDFVVEFRDEPVVGLRCLACNLASKYSHLKASIAKTNDEYSNLLAKAKDDFEREKLQQDKEERIKRDAEQRAKDSFDSLEL